MNPARWRPSPPEEWPARFVRRLRALEIRPGSHLLLVNVRRQRLEWLREEPAGRWLGQSLVCSTSKFGVGQREGSNRTPLGLHRVAEKIGAGATPGTVFKGRQAVGLTSAGLPDALITTRILWLEGMEPRVNRGGHVDSHARYIYLHGTGDQSSLGRPASHGCVHLADEDLIPLFDAVPVGTLVWIDPGAAGSHGADGAWCPVAH